MEMKLFKKGAAVELIQPRIIGTVIGSRLHEAGDRIEHDVEFVHPNGETHHRFFTADELKEVSESQPQPKARVTQVTQPVQEGGQ